MIGRNALIQLFATGLNGLITFFILSFSARLFGPEILGHLAYLFGLTGLIFAFSDLGFSRAHVHYSSQTRQPGRNLRVFLTIKLILLLFSALIASLYFYFQSNKVWFLFFVVVATEIFSRLADSILITFEALQRVFPQNLVKLIAKLVKLLSLIILAQVLRSEVGYGLTYFAEAVTLVFLAACLLTRFLPLSFDRPLLKEYLIYSLPFFVIIPLSYFQDNSLIVILKKFQPAAQVGYYSASVNLIGFVKSLYAGLMLFFFPRVSKLFATQKITAMQTYTDMAVRYLLIIFSPLLILLYFFRRELITWILGPQFIPAIPVFSWLLLGLFILMFLAPYDQVLFASRQQRSLVPVSLVSLMIAVSFSFALVPHYAAVGTVTASLLAWLISGFWHLYLVRSRLKLRLYSQLLSQLGISLLSFILLAYLVSIFQPRLMLKLGLGLAVLLIYFALVLKAKLLTRLDLKYLKKCLTLNETRTDSFS